VAGVIELVGGLLLLVGLFARPAAFILSGEMAVAYFMIRPPRGFFPLLNGGESEVFYCFAFLYLAFAGAGPWSLDQLWRRRSLKRRDCAVIRRADQGDAKPKVPEMPKPASGQGWNEWPNSTIVSVDRELGGREPPPLLREWMSRLFNSSRR
jgi:hypothetical protein